jgi:hypothetical protein
MFESERQKRSRERSQSMIGVGLLIVLFKPSLDSEWFLCWPPDLFFM